MEPIVYTSESRAPATVECLVHVPLSLIPTDLSIAAIEIPGDISPQEVPISELPADWRNYPAPLQLADIGTRWASGGKTLLLRVPSVVVVHEFNILINPLHPDMNRVAVSSVEDYRFDDRLLQSGR